MSKRLPTHLSTFTWSYLKQYKWFQVAFWITSIAWAVNMALGPYFLKIIINGFTLMPSGTKHLPSNIIWAIGGYIGLSIVMNAAFRLFDYVNLTLYPALKSSIAKDMFSYLLGHSSDFFQNNFAGNLVKKTLDMCDLQKLIEIFNIWFHPRFLAMIICSVVLFYGSNKVFSVILLTWAVFFILISYLMAKKTTVLAYERASAFSNMSGAMSDSITNIISVKLFSSETNELNNFSKEVDHLVNSDRKLQWKTLKLNFIQDSSITVLIIIMLATLIWEWQNGLVTPGDFALVLMISISFSSNVREVGSQILEFSKIIGSCDQALSFVKIPHSIVNKKNSKQIQVFSGEINFKSVCFKYEKSDFSFSNLSVSIKPGEKVGIVGYSGGGKSTFVKLILRLIEFQSGLITIDGQNIQDMTIDSIRKNISVIPQELDLFHRNILENIRFSKPEASDEEVIEASKKARCHSFISNLPDGYQSLVGERGVKLSGGQKQRIAIARAFLKNSPILILDEATASLDAITEQYVQEGLLEVMHGKTTLVIAHRFSTLKNMDRILVFVEGKIVEDGPMRDLIQCKDSHFYRLFEQQRQGFEIS